MDNNKQENTIKTVTLLSMWKDRKFTAISKLRKNVNNLYFLTFINGKSSQNVYFSKNLGKKIAENFVEGQDLLENKFLVNAEICQTINENKDVRYKLIVPSLESDYSSTSSLEAAFGASNTSEFDMDGFMSLYQDSASNAVKAEVPQEQQS